MTGGGAKAAGRRAPLGRVRLAVSLACIVTMLAAGALAFADRAFPPDFSRMEDVSTVVRDREGAPLRFFMTRDEKWRLATGPGDVDPLYLAMLKAYEDKRFDRHFGVDPIAVLRAAGQAAARGRIVSGASTLTMQAARLLEPRPRGVVGKAVEAFRAVQIEARVGKQGALAAYLTLAPFGGPVEGVRAASLKLFGREPTMLTPAEAALLVAIPQAPNERRPDRRPEAAQAARAAVLARAVEAGIITAADAAAAETEPLPREYRASPFLAPHLAAEIAAAAPPGAEPRTTIDAALQAKVERRLRAARSDFAAPTTFAAIVVDAETAEVRALAGGPDFFDRRRAGMLDLTTAVRSPGSALKPFVYGLAFDRLLAMPETLIGDRPFREPGYAPTNFSGGYQGDVTVAEALVASLNVPAVKVLRRIGPERFDAALATAGFALAFDREGGDAGLAIALGGVGASLRDLARAYVALAHAGRMPDRLSFRPEETVEWRSFVSPGAAADVRRILAAAPPPPGWREDAALPFKTGTSYGFRDAVAVGMTAGHVVAVWVGRPDGASCAGCVGRTAAGPILFDIAGMLPGAGASAPNGTAAPSRPVPPHLVHFDRPSRRSDPSAPPIELRFPEDGAEIRLGRSGAAPLIAVGGAGPYRWLVDGAPVGRSRPGAALRWRPAGGGFHDVLAVDAGGRSARARVFVGVD